MRSLVGVLMTSLALGLSARAYALQEYADAIADELDLRDKPSCLYCHARNERGLATDTPFGDALKNRGFTRRLGTSSLRTALDRLQADGTDSDGDGVSDYDELSAYADPNDPSDEGLPPAEGCNVSGGATPWSSLWLIAISVWALRWRTAQRRT